MKIGLITYDVPHLKTQQVFFRLIEKKYEINFFFTKFKPYKIRKTLYPHRPPQLCGPDIFKLSKKYKIRLEPIENIKKFNSIQYFLICGAGLIDSSLIIKEKFINCHPGLIPLSRGLDSFKWSIYHNRPMGNTLHFINDRVDNGKVIFHKKTPIFLDDDYQTLAKRHYEMELDMLVNFERYLKKKQKFILKSNKPKLRMPKNFEVKMIKRFKTYKIKNKI